LVRCASCGHLGHQQRYCPVNPTPIPRLQLDETFVPQGMNNLKRRHTVDTIGSRTDIARPLAGGTLAIRPDQIAPGRYRQC
jgi:hypothetical protein